MESLNFDSRNTVPNQHDLAEMCESYEFRYATGAYHNERQHRVTIAWGIC